MYAFKKVLVLHLTICRSTYVLFDFIFIYLFFYNYLIIIIVKRSRKQSIRHALYQIYNNNNNNNKPSIKTSFILWIPQVETRCYISDGNRELCYL